MIQSHIGEFVALLTAFCWTITSVAFEAAGKKVGSLSVNLIRLVMAFVLVGLYTYFTRGMFLPLDAEARAWGWLIFSGLIGFVIGDLFLFQAFVEVGSRISMLVMASVPPITAIFGYIILGEKLTAYSLIGMVITISGIAMVVLQKNGEKASLEFSHPVKGLIYAFLGALGQSFGMIFSKFGMGNYNVFAATQIRIIAGLIGFSILFFVKKEWGNVGIAVKNKSAMGRISIGAFFGPFLGVSLSLLAIQYTTTGVVSTITSIVPVLIIPPAMIFFKEKVTLKEAMGAIVTVVGVGFLFV